MLLTLDILTTAAILFIVVDRPPGDLRRPEDHQLRPRGVADGRRLLRRGDRQARAQSLGGAAAGLRGRRGARRPRRALHHPPALPQAAGRDPRHLGARHRGRPAHHPGLRPRRPAHPEPLRRAPSRSSASTTRPTGSWPWASPWSIGTLFALTIERTRLGLSARAVIMNETLARSLGIDTGRVRLVVFMIGAGLRGAGGRPADAADQRRSEHGRQLADRRLHAGDGRRRLVPGPRGGLPRLRGRAGPDQHLREPDPGQHRRRGAGRPRAARSARKVSPVLETAPRRRARRRRPADAAPRPGRALRGRGSGGAGALDRARSSSTPSRSTS